jgi:mono/diheme cytochrome c family protein
MLAILAAACGARIAATDEPASGRSPTIWDGVYTAGQARRGEGVYAEPCGKCHGYRLDGAPDDPDMFSTPPVAGQKFLRDWNGQTLAALYEYTRTTMPANNPGSLSDAELADVIAYMLSVSGAPAGERALDATSARFGRIAIVREPG